MDVREIVGNYLRANGFDGLMGDEKGSGNCSCDLDDLMPCDEPCDRCEPGYKAKCTGQCNEFDHCIVLDKNYRCSFMINDEDVPDNVARIEAYKQFLRKLLTGLNCTIAPEIKKEIEELLGEEKE